MLAHSSLTFIFALVALVPGVFSGVAPRGGSGNTRSGFIKVKFLDGVISSVLAQYPYDAKNGTKPTKKEVEMPELIIETAGAPPACLPTFELNGSQLPMTPGRKLFVPRPVDNDFWYPMRSGEKSNTAWSATGGKEAQLSADGETIFCLIRRGESNDPGCKKANLFLVPEFKGIRPCKYEESSLKE